MGKWLVGVTIQKHKCKCEAMQEKRNENLVKYRKGKRMANIFKYVIDIPFPGKIFSVNLLHILGRSVKVAGTGKSD